MQKRKEKPTETGTVTGLQEASQNRKEMELSADQKTLTDRKELIESKAVDLQMNLDETSLCQFFLQQSYERVKSLKCGRTGKVIKKLNGLSTIFHFARIFGSQKQAEEVVDENSRDNCAENFSFRGGFCSSKKQS